MESIQLSNVQKFSYYLLPIILVCLGFIPLYFWIAGKTNQHLTNTITILSAILFFILALLIFIRQKKSLKLYSIVSEIDVKEKTKIIRDILKEYGWIFKNTKYNTIQAEGNDFRNNLDIRTWSELLTIVIHKKEIKINSICDPTYFVAQAFSFGKNKQNMKDFEVLFLHRTSN